MVLDWYFGLILLVNYIVFACGLLWLFGFTVCCVVGVLLRFGLWLFALVCVFPVAMFVVLIVLVFW